MTTTFENAKVGDRVYSLIDGYGHIISNGHMETYPLMVKFGNSVKSFSDRGFFIITALERELFWDKPTIIAPEQPKPKPVAPPVDTLVDALTGGNWRKRYSVGELYPDGDLKVWANGATSHTTNGDYIRAQEWRLPQGNKT